MFTEDIIIATYTTKVNCTQWLRPGARWLVDDAWLEIPDVMMARRKWNYLVIKIDRGFSTSDVTNMALKMELQIPVTTAAITGHRF